MTEREIWEKMLKDGGCVVWRDECPLRKLIGKCDCFSSSLFNKRIKAKLAEMDAEEKPKQMTCGVLNKLVHAIENDKLIWQNATRTNGDDGSVIFKFECRKPLAQPKTAEDFRDHTLGEVMELGYVVTIKEND